MNFKKLTAVFTAICFVYSGIVAPAVQAAVSPGAPDTGALKETLNGLLIPATVGRITDAKYYGSGKVVVNIQDLHCHPEVQRNISRILGELDGKYALKAVYLEGGYGDIDTSWLSGLKDERFRKDAAETMLNEGRLTGTEYYAVMKNRPHLLKGIEDEELHRGNIARLGKMLEMKGKYSEQVKLLDRDLEFLEAKYFTDRNRRFNQVVEAFREGKLPAEKYYRLLGKYVEKINRHPYSFNTVFTIDMNDYPNIKGYLELQEKGKRLNYRRVSRQLQGFVRELKKQLPYSTYNYVLEKTDNFSKLDTLYVILSQMRREYAWDVRTNYPDLEKFFAYVEKGQEVNPVRMIKEEKKLVEQIRIGFAQDVSELEVSFAADFYGYFRDYLLNRLAADDYRYFTERIGKFKEIWGKYTYVNRLKEMEGEFGLLDEYYQVNEERNRVFLEKVLAEGGNSGTREITEEKAAEITGKENEAADDIRRVMGSLEKSPEIVVVVAGGFHTEGLQALLGEQKVTYLSITPNVTQDTKTSSAVYEEFAKQQAKVLSYGKAVPTSYLNVTGMFKTAQNTVRETIKNYVRVDFRHSDALALTVASCEPDGEKLRPLANALIRKLGRKDMRQTVTELTRLMQEMGIAGTIEQGEKDTIRVTIHGQTVTLGQESAARPGASETGPSLKSSAECAADAWLEMCALLSGTSDSSLTYKLVIRFARWLARNDFITGTGLIYPVASDPGLLRQMAKLIPEDELAKLPPALQKAIAGKSRFAQALQEQKGRDAFSAALLAITPLRTIIEAVRSGGSNTAGTQGPRAFTTSEIDTLKRYIRAYLADENKTALFEHNEEELLDSLINNTRLATALRPARQSARKSETGWFQNIGRNSAVYQRDLINNMDPALRNRIFEGKLFYGDREESIRQYLSRVRARNPEQGFFSGLDLSRDLRSQGITVDSVIDYSSGKVAQEGAFVYRVLLRRGEDTVSLFMKGLGIYDKEQRPNAMQYHVAYYDIAQLCGLNSIAITGSNEAYDEQVTGYLLMDEIPGMNTNELFDLEGRKFTIKSKYAGYQDALIDEFARYGALSDLLNRGDSRIVQNINPMFPANFMISLDALAQGRSPAVYGIDHNWLFNDQNMAVADLKKGGNVEMGILLAFGPGWEELFPRYQASYLKQWQEIVARSGAIRDRIVTMFGENSHEVRVFDASIAADPQKMLNEQKAALREFFDGPKSGSIGGDAAPADTSEVRTEGSSKKPGIKNIILPVMVLFVLIGSLLFPVKALAQAGTVGTPAVTVSVDTLHKDGETSLKAIVKEFNALTGSFQQPIETSVEWGPDGLVFDNAAANDRVARLNAFIDAIEPDFNMEEIDNEALRRYMGKYQDSYGQDWSIENAKKEIKKVVILMWLVDQSGDGRTILQDLKGDSALIYIDEMDEASSIGATRDGTTKITINEELSGDYFDEAAALSRVRMDLFDMGTDKIDALFKALHIKVSSEDLNSMRSPSSMPALVIIGGISGAVALLVKIALSKKRRSRTPRRTAGQRTDSSTRTANRRAGESGKTAEPRQRTSPPMSEVIRSAIDRIDAYLRQAGGRSTSRMFETFDQEMEYNAPYRMVSKRLRNLMQEEQYRFNPSDFLGLVRETLLRMELDPTVTNERLNRIIKENVESFLRSRLHDFLKVRYDAYAQSSGGELDRLIRDLRSREYNDFKFSAGLNAEYMRDIFVGLYDRIRGKVIGFNNTSIEKINLSGTEYIELILRALEDEEFEARLEKEVGRILEQKWSAQRARREAEREQERERQRQREQQRQRYTSDDNRGDQEQQRPQSGDTVISSAYDITPDGRKTVHDFKLDKITNDEFERDKDNVIRQCIRAFLTFYALLKEYDVNKYNKTWTPEKEAKTFRALAACRTAAELESIDVKDIVSMYRLMAKTYHTDRGNGEDRKKIIPQVNNAYEFLTKDKGRSGALLPVNSGRYLKRMMQGWPEWLALTEVHVHELPLILFTPPASFDLRHGEANSAREQAARAMQRSFWASMIPGLVLTLGGIMGLVPAALVLGVMGAGVTAGIAISGILHVQYDSSAAIPMAFFVTQDPASLDAEKLDSRKRGYAPVVVTSVSRLRGEARNVGIKIQGQDVWTKVDDRGVLTVYVAGENEEFAKNASGMISVLKGYGNLRGNGRAVRMLGYTGGQALDASRTVVFDYTNGIQLVSELSGVPVLDGQLAVNAGYGAIVNVHNAEQWPREIAFERPWSDGLGAAGDRLNNSLVLGMADLDAAGTEKIWSLKKKGARVYLRYAGNSLEELAGKIQTYGLDGVICSELSANADELARAAGNPDLWVAGPSITGETARKYEEIDLLKGKGKLGSIKPYTVVKVTLGEGYTLEDVLALNRLPATCVIVFDGKAFIRDTNQPSRDMTLLGTFGVNVLELLKIAPVSREEQEEYERRVAYRLDMGTFEAPADLEADMAGILKGEFGGIPGNAAFLEAVRLHMLGTRDEGLKGIFLGAVAERMHARARLAALKPAKADGLADAELERLYGELLVREDANAAADDALLTKLAQFAAERKAEEVYTEFTKTAASLKAKARQNDPQAVSTLIRLIELYAEPRFKVSMSREDVKVMDQRTVKKILEAA